MRSLHAFLATFLLEFRLGVRSWRFLVFVIAFLAPVLLAGLPGYLSGRNVEVTTYDVFLGYVNLLYFMLLVPLATLVHSSGMVSSHVEQGTWPYHLLTPLAKWQTMLAKYAASVAVVWILTFPSIYLTMLVLAWTSHSGALPLLEITHRAVLATGMSVLAYAAIFGLFGVAFQRPLVMGVIYGLVSEFALQAIPGTTVIRRFTVIFHARGLWIPEDSRSELSMRFLDRSAFVGLPGGTEATLSLLGLAVALLIFASIVLRQRQLAVAQD